MATTQATQSRFGGQTASAVAAEKQAVLPLSISVEGLEGTGKSRFALLTAPTPVVHVNFGDRSGKVFAYDMDEERQKAVEFFEFHSSTPQGWTRDEGMRSLIDLTDLAKEKLADGRLAGGTFVLDSGSSWWEAIQEVYIAPEMEKQEAAGGRRTGGLVYMRGNLVVNGVVNWIKNQGCHLIITHRKTQDWNKDGPIPGKYSAQINRKVPYLVEIRLDLHKLCIVCGGEFCEAAGHAGRRHVARLLKFGRNTMMEGLELEGEQITFANVYRMYTGRDLV